MAILRPTGVATITLNGKETLVRRYTGVADTVIISGVSLVRNLKDGTGERDTETVNTEQTFIADGATEIIATLTTTHNVDEVIEVSPTDIDGLPVTARRSGSHEIEILATNDTGGGTANIAAGETLTVTYESEEGDDVAVRPTNVTATMVIHSGDNFDEIIVLKSGPQGGFTQKFGMYDHTAVYTNLAINALLTEETT